MTYAGDVTPEAAFAALQADPEAVLVDVRTAAEWTYVGVPDLSGLDKRVLLVEWQSYPSGTVNATFADDVAQAGVAEGQPVYLLCRSGVRSIAAAEALTAAGYGPAYNVLDGFEGPLDAHGHRSVGGWRNLDLPWRQ